MFLGKRCRMVAVEDCNDDDQSDGVGKGKLRVLGAFKNLSKCVGSTMAMVDLAALSVSSSNLISIAARSKEGPNWRWISLGMKKSSIGGEQYLDYL
jgi:hypothetical protein